MKTIIRQNVFVKPETSKIAQGCVIVGTGDTTDMLLAQRISANVRYWHKADITTAPIHVRFGGKADIAIALRA